MADGHVEHLPRIRIGDAMELYGMTARALRFYEERGLLVAHRDRLNRRFYDDAARRRLAWITVLRDAGLPLLAIAAVLEAEDRTASGRAVAVEKLKTRRSLLEFEIARIDAALGHVTDPLGGLGKARA